MDDGPHRTDAWIQWAILLLTILGGVWTMGGRLAAIDQRLKDNADLFDIQSKRISNLEQEVIDLTKHLK